jgi:hypothetical protein
MLSNQYQAGGSGLELLSAAGAGDGAKGGLVAISGASNGGREYDRTVKGYVVVLEKLSPTALIKAPASSKDCLGVVQPFLVLQALVQHNAPCSIEIGVQTTAASLTAAMLAPSASRKRIHLSTAFREFESNELHVKLPWAPMHRLEKLIDNAIINEEFFTCIHSSIYLYYTISVLL